MRIEETAIPGVAIIHLDRHDDERGLFCETYDSEDFRALGIETAFVLDAVSVSAKPGTVRGLHFQSPPHAQDKLVRVARGRAFDVVVDIRHGSPTFGRHTAVELAADGWRQVYIPVGFAHGFCTLEADTEIVYKLSRHHALEQAMGILWNDPDLGIDWPVSDDEAILSQRDRAFGLLKDLPLVFDAGA